MGESSSLVYCSLIFDLWLCNVSVEHFIIKLLEWLTMNRESETKHKTEANREERNLHPHFNIWRAPNFESFLLSCIPHPITFFSHGENLSCGGYKLKKVAWPLGGAV